MYDVLPSGPGVRPGRSSARQVRSHVLTGDRRTHRRWAAGLAIVSFWTFAALLAVASGKHHFTHLGQALHLFADNYAWAALTPLIFYLGDRFPVDRERTATSLPVHIAAAGLVGITWGIFSDYSHAFLEHPEESNPAFPDVLATRVAFGFGDGFLIYFAILAAGLAISYYRKYQERQAQAARLRSELVQARLQALRMQLQPHFLFNTLNAASGLVERDPDATRQMLTQLSDLLRDTLDGSEELEVTLSRELRYLDNYAGIVTARFRDRLQVSFDIDPDTLDALVPPLIVQPLVENALKHGILAQAGKGRIGVRSARVAETVELVVWDTGPGVGHAERVEEGTGIRNVRARLEHLYGGRASLVLENAPGGGGVARLRLPYHEESALMVSDAGAGSV